LAQILSFIFFGIVLLSAFFQLGFIGFFSFFAAFDPFLADDELALCIPHLSARKTPPG
jgi:hypothetical protein